MAIVASKGNTGLGDCATVVRVVEVVSAAGVMVRGAEPPLEAMVFDGTVFVAAGVLAARTRSTHTNAAIPKAATVHSQPERRRSFGEAPSFGSDRSG
jgi:hypothetical protein